MTFIEIIPGLLEGKIYSIMDQDYFYISLDYFLGKEGESEPRWLLSYDEDNEPVPFLLTEKELTSTHWVEMVWVEVKKLEEE
jgi:hypothetical protein